MIAIEAMGTFFAEPIANLLKGKDKEKFINKNFKIWKKEFNFDYKLSEFLSYALCFIICLIYVITNHYLFNNILAFCFTIGGIVTLKIGKFY